MRLLLKYYSYVSLGVLLVSCFLFYFVDNFCHVLLSTSCLFFPFFFCVHLFFIYSQPICVSFPLPAFCSLDLHFVTSSCLPRCPQLGPHHYANHNSDVSFQPFTFTLQVWLLITFQSTCLNFPARFSRFTFICLTLVIP